MTPPSARARKRADAALAEAVALDPEAWVRLGPDAILAAQDCVARALDAEREACAKLAKDYLASALNAASDTVGEDVARLIRALADEER
jgi:hypothetical protein